MLDSFEPAGWAILRGIIAVYSCIALLTFSFYDGYTELQLHSKLAYTVKETILPITECAPVAYSESTTSVTAFTTDLVCRLQLRTIMILIMIIKAPIRLSEPTVVLDINPPPVLSPDIYYSNPVPGVWAQNFGPDQARDFNLRWTGNYSLVMWATEADSVGFVNSTQVGLTSPLILAPFKQYDISLITTKYILGSFSFISYRPGACCQHTLYQMPRLIHIAQAILDMWIADSHLPNQWRHFHSIISASPSSNET